MNCGIRAQSAAGLLTLALTACDSGQARVADPAPAGAEVAAVAGALVIPGEGSAPVGPISRWYNTASFQEREALKTVLADLAAARKAVRALASSRTGAWVVASDAGNFFGGTLPSGLRTAVADLSRNGQAIRAVSINAADGWVAVGAAGWRSGGAVPRSAKDKIAQYFANGWAIRDVDISESGYVVLGSGTLASYSGTDADLQRYLADRLRSKRRVEQVALGFDGRWAAIAGQEPASEGLSSQLASRLATSAADEVHMSKLMIGPGDSYVLYCHGRATPTPGNVMEAIEYGVPGGDNLWERMSASGIPGLSIAIVEDNQVAYARGYGLLKAGGERHVLATTPFDMASLSKFIGALTMMRLDTDTRYAFDVDDSLVGRARPGGIIADWLAEGTSSPAAYGFPDVAVSSQLTIAHFMRHQSDFVKSGGSPGFSSLGSLSGVSTLDLMLGWDCSSGCDYNGANFAWSSGGAGPVSPSYDSVNFLVPQAVAEDVTGLSAQALMRDYFFKGMGLTRISGDPGDPILADAAWPHDDSGPRASRALFPWTFAGGINAAPADYAEMMILALNQGRDSAGVERIPAAAIQRLLQVQNNSVAFGLFADASGHITETNDNRFKHSGAHGGRARSYMCGNPTRDGGIVIAINADIGDGPDAGTGNDTNDLRTYIVGRFMAAVGWPGDCL
jgi:CubicO group peptidase (beta-lactamase class C family)